MINLRKKHQSQLIVSQPVETQLVDPMPAQTERAKPRTTKPRAKKSSGGGRSPAQRSIPVERPDGPPRSNAEETDGSIWLAIIVIVIGVAIWKWNQSDDNPPAPTPVQQQNEASSGQGPGWWTEDDLPEDSQSASPPVQTYQEQQFAESLRDALISSLDRNGDGVIDADEVVNGEGTTEQFHDFRQLP